GLEVLDLRRDLGRVVGSVEVGDSPNAGDALDEVGPDGLEVAADRRDEPEARDRHTAAVLVFHRRQAYGQEVESRLCRRWQLGAQALDTRSNPLSALRGQQGPNEPLLVHSRGVAPAAMQRNRAATRWRSEATDLRARVEQDFRTSRRG